MTKTLAPKFPWSITDDDVPTRSRTPRLPVRGGVNVTIETLLEKIRAAGLLAIGVEAVLDRENDMAFAGDLDAYLSAIKTLHGDVVFFSSTTLDSDDFVCEDDFDDDGTGSGSRDLCDIQPNIGKFKSNIGAVGQFDLAAYTGTYGLTISIVTDWYSEFLTLRDSALGVLDAKTDRENARREAEQEERLQNGLQKLEALSGDRAFMGLPTQRAMRAYALEHIPELTNIDDHDLKTAIADLKARIQARGSVPR